MYLYHKKFQSQTIYMHYLSMIAQSKYWLSGIKKFLQLTSAAKYQLDPNYED